MMWNFVFLDEKAEILKLPAKSISASMAKATGFYKIVGYQIPREMTQKIKLNYEGKTVYEGYLTINNK